MKNKPPKLHSMYFVGYSVDSMQGYIKAVLIGLTDNALVTGDDIDIGLCNDKNYPELYKYCINNPPKESQ